MPKPRGADTKKDLAHRSKTTRPNTPTQPKTARKTLYAMPYVPSYSLDTLHTDLTESSHATSCGEGIGQPTQEGPQDIIHRMRLEEQAHAIHLLHKLGIATRGLFQSHSHPAQYVDNSQGGHPPSTSTREATMRATKLITDVHATAAAAAASRDQQVADFVSTTGAEAHAAAIAAGATEEEFI